MVGYLGSLPSGSTLSHDRAIFKNNFSTLCSWYFLLLEEWPPQNCDPNYKSPPAKLRAATLGSNPIFWIIHLFGKISHPDLTSRCVRWPTLLCFPPQLLEFGFIVVLCSSCLSLQDMEWDRMSIWSGASDPDICSLKASALTLIGFHFLFCLTKNLKNFRGSQAPFSFHPSSLPKQQKMENTTLWISDGLCSHGFLVGVNKCQMPTMRRALYFHQNSLHISVRQGNVPPEFITGTWSKEES